MGGRATVISVLAGLMACGGKSGPATTARVPAPSEEPQPVAQQPAPAPGCPDLTATLRDQADEGVTEDFEAVVRDYVRGRFAGRVGFLVFGSIGPLWAARFFAKGTAGTAPFSISFDFTDANGDVGVD